MFTLSKILAPFADPRVLAFLVLIAGTLLLWTRAKRLGRIVVTAVVVLTVFLTVVPVGDMALTPLEERFPPVELPDRVDGIIVLGGDFDSVLMAYRGRASLGESSAGRVLAFADLARRYPDARLVFTGGSGNLLNPQAKDAIGGADILHMAGIPLSRVRFEDNSRNTFENATMALPIAQPAAGETWVLVTSAYHMPRAMGCFRRAGWMDGGVRLIPYPVDYRTARGRKRLDFRFEGGLRSLQIAVHEWLGLVVYYALGHIDTLFPRPTP